MNQNEPQSITLVFFSKGEVNISHLSSISVNILYISEVYQTVLFSVVLGFYFLVYCVCLLIPTVLGFFMCIVVLFMS